MHSLLSHTFIFEGLKPFSVNSAYIRTFSGVAKSSGANEFCAQIFNTISGATMQNKLATLRDLFDPQQHSYEVSITCTYPKAEFITKGGTISSRTIDCTNYEKLIVDALWLPKFHERPFPEGAPNLNCDDRFITTLHSHKRAGDGRRIEVTISILKLIS